MTHPEQQLKQVGCGTVQFFFIFFIITEMQTKMSCSFQMHFFYWYSQCSPTQKHRSPLSDVKPSIWNHIHFSLQLGAKNVTTTAEFIQNWSRMWKGIHDEGCIIRFLILGSRALRCGQKVKSIACKAVIVTHIQKIQIPHSYGLSVSKQLITTHS